MRGSTHKRKAIKGMFDRLGMQATPEQVVEALAALGVEVSETHVSRLRAEIARDEAKAQWRGRTVRPADRRRKRPQQRKIPARRR